MAARKRQAAAVAVVEEAAPAVIVETAGVVEACNPAELAGYKLPPMPETVSRQILPLIEQASVLNLDAVLGGDLFSRVRQNGHVSSHPIAMTVTRRLQANLVAKKMLAAALMNGAAPIDPVLSDRVTTALELIFSLLAEQGKVRTADEHVQGIAHGICYLTHGLRASPELHQVALSVIRGKPEKGIVSGARHHLAALFR